MSMYVKGFMLKYHDEIQEDVRIFPQFDFAKDINIYHDGYHVTKEEKSLKFTH